MASQVRSEVHSRPSRGSRQQASGQSAGVAAAAARRAADQEVGHHLTFALHRDHAPVLQRVVVGGQHLLQVRSHLHREETLVSRLTEELGSFFIY